MLPKLIQRNIPPERENTNDRFRVKYGNKNDFEILEVKITRLATGKQQVFQFNAANLPDKDSIYFSTSIMNNKLQVKWFNIQPLPTKTKYSCFEFDGELLNPSFSIYLFEIIKENDGTYFYVGMTGDNYYPSARSIMHRLGGHIDLSKQSTQSQMIIALKGLFGKEKHQYLSLEELKTLKIKLHHWAIDGFARWEGDYKNLIKEDPKYNSYLEARAEISSLENQIIYDCTDKLLNQTKGKDCKDLKADLREIYNDVKEKILRHKNHK